MVMTASKQGGRLQEDSRVKGEVPWLRPSE